MVCNPGTPSPAIVVAGGSRLPLLWLLLLKDDDDESAPVVQYSVGIAPAPVPPTGPPRTPVRSLYAMSPIGYMGMMLPKSKSVGKVHSGESRALLSEGTLEDVGLVPRGVVNSVLGVGWVDEGGAEGAVAVVLWLVRCEEDEIDEACASDCEASQREAASVSARAMSLQWQVKNP